jgi:catechol 2,3-dioxygenase-like lactoylglutathione lyase family enzyme
MLMAIGGESLAGIALQTKGKTMEVNGIAHVFLTASNYCVRGRTAVDIRAPSPEYRGAAFEQNRVGLHHLCFRARERADVDVHAFLGTLDSVNIIRAPREDQWAPGYYSLLFEDPDGIRLELNHVPGKGLLA